MTTARTALCLLLCFLFVLQAFGQAPRPTFIKHAVLSDPDKWSVYVSIFPEYASSQFEKDYKLRYMILENYNSKEPLMPYTDIDISLLAHEKSPEQVKFSLQVPKINSPLALMVLEVHHLKSNQKNYADIRLVGTKPLLREEFAVFDEKGLFPVFQGFILAGSTVMLRNSLKQEKLFYATRYRQDFGPAPAPMYLSQLPANQNMSVDSTFTVRSNQMLQLSKEGLYLFRKDTNDFHGIGLRVEPQGFPKLTQKEQLILPLTYISTSEELKKLFNSRDLKKELDRYWLKLMGGNANKAKTTIKEYYKRIREANMMYASFKEGWKTDMGMVYIVFGAPQEILRGKDIQQWTYIGSKNYSKVTFSFTRKPNQFVDEHYTLVRYIEYEPIWYPTVELWRKGTVSASGAK